MARARRLPAKTTLCLARVTAVESRLRCSIIQALMVRGTTAQGYSLPWERWMLTA